MISLYFIVKKQLLKEILELQTSYKVKVKSLTLLRF